MSRQAKLALAVLAGAIAIAVLMVTLRSQPEGLPREERAPLVQTVPLQASSGPLTVRGSGTVQPSEEVTVSPQISGRLVYVNPQFREGGFVGSGATLFRIDQSDYRNRVQSAQADVAAQDVAVLQAQEEARIAQDELDRFANRERRPDLALQTVDGNDYAARILPPRELDEAAEGAVARSRTTVPTRLATRQPQLRSARAAKDRAAAQLADARLALGRTTVRAPFGGLVRSETAAIGKLVQAGEQLGSIVAAASYDVRVSLTEREAALIPGLLEARRSRIPASVFSDYGAQTFRWSAYVDRADAILDPQTRTIDVFLKVSDPLRGGVSTTSGGTSAAPPLLLGSYVRAEIIGGAGEAFVQIPAEALRPGNQIWVVRSNRLRILPVRLLQRTDRIAVVAVPDLGKGDRLVTSPLRTPVDGMRVRMDKPVRKKPSASQNAETTRTDG